MKRMCGVYLLIALLAVFWATPALGESTLASAKTPLTDASAANLSNLHLACDALNGTMIDSWSGYFSFNETIGPRTASYGYKNAINGRGVKAMGGGVAQLASTLYLALCDLPDIAFDEVETYGSKFTETYVSSKDDAILIDYRGGIDFTFYNDGDTGFRIDAWMDGDYVYCALVNPYGGGDGYASIALTGGAALENNITLAADSIYDTTLEYRDLFSFNDTVGPRTQRNGYVSAVNGRGVEVVGGGCAQVASAIYLAVRDLGCVEFVSFSTYGDRYNQRYVTDARSAVLVDYKAGIDFSFRYVGEGSLSLYTYVSGDTLFCEAIEW